MPAGWLPQGSGPGTSYVWAGDAIVRGLVKGGWSVRGLPPWALSTPKLGCVRGGGGQLWGSLWKVQQAWEKRARSRRGGS